jgi:predicted site-specific integrase-resolvase
MAALLTSDGPSSPLLQLGEVMANALVVRSSKAIAAQSDKCAAQYVRMSTDYQRYSIENQAAVIAAYAQLHGLNIVRTYRDAGESGLKLKNRAGLTRRSKNHFCFRESKAPEAIAI